MPEPTTDLTAVVGRLTALAGPVSAVGFRVTVLRSDLRAILAAVARGQEALERLAAGLLAVESLVNESHGVSGLHLNGDVADWESLRTGGRFEEWLLAFDAAISAARAATGEG